MLEFIHEIAQNGQLLNKPAMPIPLFSSHYVSIFMHFLTILLSSRLDDTLGPDSLQFIINHAEIEVLVCSHDKLTNVFAILHSIPSLRVIVCIAESIPSTELIASICKNHQIEFFTWKETMEYGKANPIAFVPPNPESLATICYTSGTTGIPKGALLTHRNLSNPSGGLIQSGIPIYPTDIHISYLPLAHVYERAVVTVALSSGASVGFFSGDINQLMDDIAILRPTVFFSVPRLLNKIYTKLVQNTIEADGMKGYLSRRCFKTKLQNQIKYGKVTHPFWDLLICNKIRQVLGGRVRVMLSGSAPIEPAVVSFLSAAFCCYMFEGYGSTETCCFGALTFNNDFTTGHIGGPPYGCQLKLIDIPEMGYLTKDKQGPKGEICLKGPSIFKGYYKEKELTREALTVDGWFATGDVGHIREDGKLSLIDRKKNIFKLAHGEYIAPEKLENIYTANSPFIFQLFVYGDSLKSYLVAIVVLDPEIKSKLNNAISKSVVLKDMERIAQHNNLNSFEYIRNIHIESDPFTIENDFLTPTLKFFLKE